MKNVMIQPNYIVPSQKSCQQLVIFLHGYGSSGADLIELGHFWSSTLSECTFISPNAPHKWEGGPFGFQWFGLKDMDFLHMRRGLESAAPALAEFIYSQARHYSLPTEQIALVGFSQGAILAFEMLYHIPKLAGIIGYAGAFYKNERMDVGKNPPPVLLVHGTQDNVVPFSYMTTAENSLRSMGVPVETETCLGLAHSIDPKGLRRGLGFLKDIFSRDSSVFAMNNN